MRKKRILWFSLGLLLVIFVVTEVITRRLGFTNQPLFREDKDFEFIALPNQDVKLYGKRFATNEFSMRSDPIAPTDTSTVLLLGDSIIFGEFSYDNDSLVSTVLEKMLTAHFKKRIRVLNISSPAWSPDNVLAYLKKYGTFHAKEMVLVVNNLDAIQKMTFAPNFGVMGGLGGLQKTNDWFGTQLLFTKIIVRTKAMMSHAKPEERPVLKEFNPGFAGLDSICKSQGIPLTIYLHSMADEITSKTYHDGGQAIIKFCEEKNIPLIKGVDVENESVYEPDRNHFSRAGHKFLAEQLYPYVLKALP